MSLRVRAHLQAGLEDQLLRGFGGQDPVLRDWEKLLADAKPLATKDKLRRVNDFFNRRIQSGDDQEIWGQSDYWATLLETLARGRGDCEDFTIGKYFTLITVPPGEQARLVLDSRTLVAGTVRSAVAFSRATLRASRQAGSGRGDFRGGEKRRAGVGARQRASSSDSSRLSERSERSERSESCGTASRRAAQGSRPERPTATVSAPAGHHLPRRALGRSCAVHALQNAHKGPEPFIV